MANTNLHITVKPYPPGVNPYVGPGRGGVPSRLERICDTTDQVRGAIEESRFLRGLTDEDVAAETGLPLEQVAAVSSTGRGRPDLVMKVLKGYRVLPVSLPPVNELMGGSSHA